MVIVDFRCMHRTALDYGCCGCLLYFMCRLTYFFNLCYTMVLNMFITLVSMYCAVCNSTASTERFFSGFVCVSVFDE